MRYIQRHISTSFRIEGVRGAALDQARGRIVLISAVFILFYLVVCIRVFDLTILQGELKAYGNQQIAELDAKQQAQPEKLHRGDIVDRNGVLLATSLKTASLYADPLLVLEPEETAKGITRIFPDQKYGEVLKKLQTKSRFVWIRRNITPEEQAKVLELGQPGLSFEDEQRRIYPQGPLASHLVGYTNVDGRGLSGIEQSFDSLLKNSADKPLRLSLDIRLQHVMRREMQNQIDHFSARGAAGVIMNAKNGEVLAAVSLPDFDPHDPSVAAVDQKFNKFSLGVYELGSTFKIFSTASLFDTLGSTMAKTYDARKPIRVGRFTISDYHPENRVMTVPEIFMHSSNIGTAHIAQDVGTENLRKFYKALGLLTPLDTEINETGSPLVPHPWKDISTLTVSYGHGIAVTPLQLMSATATIVHDGLRVKPTFVLSDETEDEKKGISRSERVLSSDTSKKMRELMRLVVTEGTGQKADVKGFYVGGKTGTAEKPQGRKYNTNALISSFVGAFPMNDPEYVVFIMIDEPKGTKDSYGYATGGWVAAPAIGRTISAMTQILSIKPDTTIEDPSEPLKKYLAGYKPPAAETPETPVKVMPVAMGMSQ